ncbi:helix-turn-helix domain-containing protein [Streptomyces sp. HMX87]|uniref:helix-turn-helix domain-containing protein n=1 Tax=Streptomyces sp. HMX87 TaxID=3390849 RepID=UPI003A86FB36
MQGKPRRRAVGASPRVEPAWRSVTRSLTLASPSVSRYRWPSPRGGVEEGITDLFVSSVGVWVGGCRGGLSSFPLGCGSALLPLSRPQLAEARRVRAVELFEDGVSNAEIARAVGVCAESVRRWRRVWEQGGASALRRRAATGRPPKLDDAQVEMVRAALELVL